MKHLVTFLKKKDLYLGFTRYILGLWMITYGLTKIIRTQCVVIPFSLWQRPLESLSGRTIAWAFLSYSPWFQILLGFLEFIPAILLLFRRTTLLGAILLLPVTLNVFLINHALHLWSDTKTISLIILILNCAILLFESKKIKAIVHIIIGKGIRFKRSILELSINLILILAASYLFLQLMLDYKNQRNPLIGDWYNTHPIEWTLQSEKINDSLLPHRLMKAYFGVYGEYSEINDTGYVAMGMLHYTIDEKRHRLNFYTRNSSVLSKCTYTLPTNTTLQIEKVIDSARNIKLTQVFKKRIINENTRN